MIHATVHELQGSSVVLSIEGDDGPAFMSVQASALRTAVGPFEVGDAFILEGHLSSFTSPDMQTGEQPECLITIEASDLQVDYGE